MSTISRSVYSLTGLRGVAAIWIACHHFSETLQDRHPDLEAFGMLHNNYNLVNMFFLLSGFMLMHVYRTSFQQDLSAKAITRFMLRRFARIYPLHVIIMFFLLILFICNPDYISWFRRSVNAKPWETYYTASGFVQTLTLSNRWLIPDFGVWNPVTWSLSAELVACAAFPFFARLLAEVDTAKVCLLIAIASLVVTCIALQLMGNPGSIGRLGLLRALGSFFAGAAACRFVHLSKRPLLDPNIAAFSSLVFIFIFVLFQHTLFLLPFCFLVLIVSLSYQRGCVDRLLSCKTSLTLGSLSYAIYLCHLPIIWYTQYFLRHVDHEWYYETLFFILSSVMIVAVSLATHLYVEVPAKKLVSKFKLYLEPKASSASLATK